MTSPQLDSLFGALADPTRRAIIAMLAERDLSAGEVAAAFDISRPAVARHMRVLRNSGIVGVQSRGRTRINHLEAAALAPAAQWIRYYERFWDDKLATLKTRIEEQEK